MKAVLELELIGDDRYALKRALRRGEVQKTLSPRDDIDLIRFAPESLRPWVARLTRCYEAPGFRREFLKDYQKDYARANSIGSRGVYAYYVLSDGVYEVNQRLNWQKARRYYLRVANGQMIELTRQEMYKCLNAI